MGKNIFGQTALHPVNEDALVHGAGIDLADRFGKLRIALCGRSLGYEEKAAVFSRKCVAERVFKKAARSNDDWRPAEILDDELEFCPDLIGKVSAKL